MQGEQTEGERNSRGPWGNSDVYGTGTGRDKENTREHMQNKLSGWHVTEEAKVRKTNSNSQDILAYQIFQIHQGM